MSTAIALTARPPRRASVSVMTVTAIGLRSEARISPFIESLEANPVSAGGKFGGLGLKGPWSNQKGGIMLEGRSSQNHHNRGPVGGPQWRSGGAASFSSASRSAALGKQGWGGTACPQAVCSSLGLRARLENRPWHLGITVRPRLRSGHLEGPVKKSSGAGLRARGAGLFRGHGGPHH